MSTPSPSENDQNSWGELWYHAEWAHTIEATNEPAQLRAMTPPDGTKNSATMRANPSIAKATAQN
jgi:hypothetical protein